MSGMLGIVVGVIVMALGLAGLGFAFGEMMTQGAAGAPVKILGGLGVFVAVCLLSLIAAR